MSVLEGETHPFVTMIFVYRKPDIRAFPSLARSRDHGKRDLPSRFRREGPGIAVFVVPRPRYSTREHAVASPYGEALGQNKGAVEFLRGLQVQIERTGKMQGQAVRLVAIVVGAIPRIHQGRLVVAKRADFVHDAEIAAADRILDAERTDFPIRCADPRLGGEGIFRRHVIVRRRHEEGVAEIIPREDEADRLTDLHPHLGVTGVFHENHFPATRKGVIAQDGFGRIA